MGTSTKILELEAYIRSSNRSNNQATTHVLDWAVRCRLKLPKHGLKDAWSKTATVGPDVFHGVPDAQHVQGVRAHLLDCRLSRLVGVGEDNLDFRSRSQKRTYLKVLCFYKCHITVGIKTALSWNTAVIIQVFTHQLDC